MRVEVTRPAPAELAHHPSPVTKRFRAFRAALVALGVAALLGVVVYSTRHHGRPSASWAERPVEELEAIVRRDPRHAGAQLGLGIQYARSGNMGQAAVALERCIALAPDSLEAHAALGEIRRRQGDNRRAAEIFAHAVRLDPSFDAGYLHAANAYTRMQSYRQARPLAAAYARRRRDDWRGPFLLGMISSGEGKMEEALQHYEESVRRAPEHGPAYLNAGATYLYGPATTERLAAAARWFERGLSVAPRYPELYYYLGLVRYRQRRWAEAVGRLRDAVALRPTLTEAYYPLAHALRRLGRLTEARLCLELYSRRRREESKR